MVQALVTLDENTNRVLNVVKARYALKDKAAAIQFVVEHYIDTKEPPLRKDFERKLKQIEKQKSIPIDTLASFYKAKHVRSSNKTGIRKNLK